MNTFEEVKTGFINGLPQVEVTVDLIKKAGEFGVRFVAITDSEVPADLREDEARYKRRTHLFREIREFVGYRYDFVIIYPDSNQVPQYLPVDVSRLEIKWYVKIEGGKITAEGRMNEAYKDSHARGIWCPDLASLLLKAAGYEAKYEISAETIRFGALPPFLAPGWDDGGQDIYPQDVVLLPEEAAEKTAVWLAKMAAETGLNLDEIFAKAKALAK